MEGDRFLQRKTEQEFITEQYGLMPPLNVHLMGMEERSDIVASPANTSATQRELIETWEHGGVVLASFSVDYSRIMHKDAFARSRESLFGEEVLLSLAELIARDQQGENIQKLIPDFDLDLISPSYNGIKLIADVQSGQFYLVMIPANGVSIFEDELITKDSLSASGQYTIVRDYIEYLASALVKLSAENYQQLVGVMGLSFREQDGTPNTATIEEIQERARERLKIALDND